MNPITDKIAVIVVAGGSGARMGAAVPKQFLPLCGMPVLMHTLGRLREALAAAEITLVLPTGHMARWAELCAEHAFDLPHRVVSGGATRFLSVRNGLGALSPCDYVLIHDGVRPLVPDAVIANVLAAAKASGAAIPATPAVESLRELSGAGSRAVDRSRFVAVQTPQAFSYETIVAAYMNAPRHDYTDDAAVVEEAGHPVALTEGSPLNLKITSPVDLAIAEKLMEHSKSQPE